MKGERTGLGAAEAGEVRSGTGELAEFVGDGTDVAASGDGHGEGGGVADEGVEGEMVDGDARGPDWNLHACAGELVGGNAIDLLSGVDRGELVEVAMKAGRRGCGGLRGCG